MLQFSYLNNGDIQLSCDTSDNLVAELFNQFAQGLVCVPHTFVGRSVYTNVCRVALTRAENSPKLVNPSYDVYEISPITRKLISRNVEHFFAGLVTQSQEGYGYVTGSATMSFGAYSVVLTKVESKTQSEPTPVMESIEAFDISVALTLQSKEEVIAYCEQFGIAVDKRMSLPKLQNWLQAKSLEGN